MKKIALVFAGARFSEGMLKFASKVNELQPVLLVGLFVPDVVNAGIYSVGTGLPATYNIPLINEDDEEMISKNVGLFSALCEREGISFRVHEHTETLALSALRRESRFADLMIIGSEKFYEHATLGDLNPSLKDILHEAECPIIIVPEQFNFPQRNILAYDGSEASVFAIKQFAYLLPELCANESILVYAKEEVQLGFPEEDSIKELATQHFKNLNFTKIHSHPQEYFNSWVKEKNDCILVSGSFSRSSFSELFKKSFLSDVVAAHKIPVFIAHR